MKLEQQRLEAAIASKGISGGAIRNAALAQVATLGQDGSLLDYGSGVGDLLNEIANRFNFRKLAGVDILPRPKKLESSIGWYQQDLNYEFTLADRFDLVISTEVVEHLENPRAMFRNIMRLLKPGGFAIITTPNQNSVRSYCALICGGHFAAFLGASYPAHITALTRLDLKRISLETGFFIEKFFYTDSGGLPKVPSVKWQTVSFGMLRGRLFSDNIGILLQKPKSGKQ